MARYIDADYIIAQLGKDISMLPDDESKFPITKGCIIGLSSTISFVKQIPTADVVPKSEVIKTLSDIKRQIHEKAMYPHNAGIKPYISVREVDAIIEKEISHVKGGG